MKQRGGFDDYVPKSIDDPIRFEIYYREAPLERPITKVAASSLEGLQGYFMVGKVVRLGDRLNTLAVEERTLGTAVHASNSAP